MIALRPILSIALAAALTGSAMAQAISAGEAEVKRCDDRIATVQREILGRYETSLMELQSGFQKAADLDGALAVRDERQRLAKEQALTSKNFVNEPKALRALQTQTLGKIDELVGQILAETLPRLVEFQKTLTINGQLDEAVAIRSAIARLQGQHLPSERVEAGAVVPADTLLLAYTSDRGRGDKLYKGQRFFVRGVVGGYRSDPASAGAYHVFLTGTAAGVGWVQCSLGTGAFRFLEEGQLNPALIVTPRSGNTAPVRLQKGQIVEIRGACDGWDEMVRLINCDLIR